jgi:SAM-dependent methyltransferase
MPAAPSETAPQERLLQACAEALRERRFESLLFAGYRGPLPGLRRIQVRALELRGELHLSLNFSHDTRDETKNWPLAEGLVELRRWLDAGFANVHLRTHDEEIQLAVSRKGRASLRVGQRPSGAEPVEPAGHNRDKQRLLSLQRPFLVELGVTDAQHRLVPAMARKWKQINKFLEIFDAALADSAAAQHNALSILDFGSGKGYLSFALHDHLSHARGIDTQLTGVEIREDMVKLCNDAAARLALHGLHFEQGDVQSIVPRPIDVMIALHACDVATDHAIHMGIRGGAAIILCAPCCHKELRPQLLSPHPLRPILRHGVHLGQEAEMLTDGVRAMLLEAEGYATQVFEFVSLEHTAKNKMILAVRRTPPALAGDVLGQVRELKAFYGIREQCLERLLAASSPHA